MLGYKDARLKAVSVKTLKDGDLPGIRSVFGWAVDNRKLAKNPAVAIKVKAEKKTRTRPKGFTDQEATAISLPALDTSGSRKRMPRLPPPSDGGRSLRVTLAAGLPKRYSFGRKISARNPNITYSISTRLPAASNQGHIG
jgi:hypothetical protein